MSSIYSICQLILSSLVAVSNRVVEFLTMTVEQLIDSIGSPLFELLGDFLLPNAITSLPVYLVFFGTGLFIVLAVGIVKFFLR